MIGGTHNFNLFIKRSVSYEDTKARRTDELARRILEISRSSILMHLRYLNSAMFRLIPVPGTLTVDLATDTQCLYYNAAALLCSYRTAPEGPARDLLHTTLHCIFRHPFVGPGIDRDRWDLACDLAVEGLITGLSLPCVTSLRQDLQESTLRLFQNRVTPFTAEKIYRCLETEDFPSEELIRMRGCVFADDHSIWYDEASAEGKDPDDSSREDRGEGDSPAGSDRGTQGGHGGGEDETVLVPDLPKEELEEIWEEISRRIQVDMDTLKRSWGEGEGDLVQELKAVNRDRCDYARFLQRFMSLGENMEINDEEFDYIFYTYGLQRYRNMPLIEPLEYKDVKRVRDLVIAIDTSESVSGELVQYFVERTWNLVRRAENFFRRYDLHIIQSGAKVQSDVKITSQEEFDAYMKNMRLLGFGGTDFRPVFRYVDELVAAHEFTDLRGIIYFTDGYGDFPEQKPDYDAAFVFCREDPEPPKVPVWAIRLVMTPEEIGAI